MDTSHYILISAIIASIVILQVYFYLKTQTKINLFKDIFPNKHNTYILKKERIAEIQNASEIKLKTLLSINGKDISQYFNKNGLNNRQQAIDDLISIYEDYEIIASHSNPVLKNIVSSINKYLKKNKGAVSDFHLMKDIVDRNCDSKEDEINMQIPVPLYLGLIGTMLGILVGVGFLVFSGELVALLSSSKISDTSSVVGVNGVNSLMGGISLAMISSIVGIFLTTWGSINAKNAKQTAEENKDTFLSWVHSELLPNLTGDLSSTFVQMTRNLTIFNNEFSTNTKELRTTLESVNESYKNQAEILKTINQLKIKEIATANIEVYENLRKCSDEIGKLGGYLETVNDYSKTLHDSVTKAGNYFDKEIEQIDERKGIIIRAVGSIDNELQDLILKIKENAETQIHDLERSTVRQTEALKQAIANQQDALNKKLQETSEIVSELRNLTAVKTSMDNLVHATRNQNDKIDSWARAINELAQKKTGRSGLFLSQWAKVLFITGFSIITVSCLIFLLKELINAIDIFLL